MITDIWFKEQQLNNLTNNIPHTIDNDTIWDKYNTICKSSWKTCNIIRWQRFLASINRLQTIQYIGQKIDIQNPNDLTNHIDHINNRSPNRDYPYLFAQYIGPSSKNSNSTWLSYITRENTARIGEQRIEYNCDINKIEKIKKLDYKSFIKAIETHDNKYRYPCKNWDLVHALAFNYYYYLQNSEKASLYYMVASFHDNIPLMTLSMPAIIIWREGNHKTSAYLRYDRLQSAYNQIKQTSNIDEQNNIQSLIDKSLKEMISEYSLYIINQSMKSAEKDNISTDCLHSLSCLQNNNYITHTIDSITKNCNSDRISCEIINLGKEYKRISSSEKLIYPSDKTMIYARDEENNKWWIAKK